MNNETFRPSHYRATCRSLFSFPSTKYDGDNSDVQYRGVLALAMIDSQNILHFLFNFNALTIILYVARDALWIALFLGFDNRDERLMNIFLNVW